MGFKDLDQLRAALRPSESPSKPSELPLVLVVDDDSHMRASLELILSRLYCVQVASNGQDGIALVRDELSTVILDVKMSGIDGFKTYEQMRRLDPICRSFSIRPTKTSKIRTRSSMSFIPLVTSSRARTIRCCFVLWKLRSRNGLGR
jgi:CheY-like chemotaxis protein